MTKHTSWDLPVIFPLKKLNEKQNKIKQLARTEDNNKLKAKL